MTEPAAPWSAPRVNKKNPQVRRNFVIALTGVLVFVMGGVAGSAMTRSRIRDQCEEVIDMGGGAVADVEAFLAKRNPERPEYELQFVAGRNEYSAAYDTCQAAPF